MKLLGSAIRWHHSKSDRKYFGYENLFWKATSPKIKNEINFWAKTDTYSQTVQHIPTSLRLAKGLRSEGMKVENIMKHKTNSQEREQSNKLFMPV